jgi:iron complex transport system ATP-binding protein
LQRCAIARALAQQAPVLVLDEPTSALDLHRQPAILDLIDDQRRLRGMTVVSTMHDITLAAMYAQQFVVLDQGRIVDAGSTFEVCQREALAKAFNHNIEIVMSPHGTPVVLPKRG